MVCLDFRRVAPVTVISGPLSHFRGADRPLCYHVEGNIRLEVALNRTRRDV